MNKIIIKLIIYAGLLLTIYIMGNQIHNLNQSLSIAVNNEKAYAMENSGLRDQNIVFTTTVNQLQSQHDSLMLVMKKVANDNGIKDKKLRALQYQLENYLKVDTIIFRDTIFKNTTFKIDTCIKDKWNSSCLHLEYPNKITISNEFRNDKYVTISAHKEPIKPKKWFLTKWLARKHTVINVLIVDQNPYVTTSKQRYVEIIKD